MVQETAANEATRSLIRSIFLSQLSLLGDIGQQLTVRMEAKKKAIENLTSLTTEIDNWNSPVAPPYEDRVAKTDALLLAGVNITQADYDFCKYKVDGSEEIFYAPFPPPIWENFVNDGKKPPNGTLVYVIKTNSYQQYQGDEQGGKLVPVVSPLPEKTKDTDDQDFSNYPPGDVVFVQATGRHYRVGTDGTGVLVIDYPLQKFIVRPDSAVMDDLKNQISNRQNVLQNLSKEDLLEAQNLSGTLNSLTTAMSGLIASMTGAMNNVARNV